MSQIGRNADALTYASWDFLKTFSVPDAPVRNDWSAIDQMQKKARAALVPAQQRYNDLAKCWEHKLQFLGEDLVVIELDEFRPLRPSREEDWSDWLAWLLKTSSTGVLAETLFGTQAKCDAHALRFPEEVEREIPTQDRERRGDILVTWKVGITVHIEVKIWDEQFEKTFDTARKLRELKPTAVWCDFILLPDESLPRWEEVLADHTNEGTVTAISWRDVAHGLRRCLWQGNESLLWQAWAWTFCTVIERRLLSLRKPQFNSPNVTELQMTLAWLEALDTNSGGS